MNVRHFYISHFFFYILHLTNKSRSNEYKIKTLSIQNSKATPYGTDARQIPETHFTAAAGRAIINNSKQQ